MVNREIVISLRQKISGGMGIQAACNMLVQQGYDHFEVDEAARFIRHENAMKAQGEAAGEPYAMQPSLMSDKNTMILIYAVSIGIIVISAAVAMYVFGMF